MVITIVVIMGFNSLFRFLNSDLKLNCNVSFSFYPGLYSFLPFLFLFFNALHYVLAESAGKYIQN
jgi:hypothetical protein